MAYEQAEGSGDGFGEEESSGGGGGGGGGEGCLSCMVPGTSPICPATSSSPRSRDMALACE